MRFDPTLAGIIIVVAAVALIALAILISARRRRSHELRNRFGTEYSHAVEAAGSRKAAERELREREQHAAERNIRPLTAGQRRDFHSEWETIEARFVERPTIAVIEADEMIQDVLRQRGFAVGSFDDLVADLSVHDPRLSEAFRDAHAILDREDPSGLSTEDLRQAMLRFRTMFDGLVGPLPASGATDVERPIASTSELEPDEQIEARRRTGRRRLGDRDRPRLR